MARLLAQTATFQNSSKLTSLARTAKMKSEDSDNSDAESYDPSAELSDAIVLETVGTAGLSGFFPEGDVSCWMFLEDFCQSSIDGRNTFLKRRYQKTTTRKMQMNLRSLVKSPPRPHHHHTHRIVHQLQRKVVE